MTSPESSQTATVDFDQFWASQGDLPPLTFRAFGETWSLNLDLTVLEMQMISQLNTDDKEGMGRVANLLFGHAYDAWLEKGLKFRQLNMVIMWGIFRVQGIDLQPNEIEGAMTKIMGKVLTPSSDTGGQLRQTSNGSTNSTIGRSLISAPVDSLSS